MIQFEHVSKIFQQNQQHVVALNDISFSIVPHEIFGIVGESGSGKTTLLHMMNHIETPDTGKIMIHGQDQFLLTKKEQRAVRKEMGMVFQQFHLLHNLTVADNIGLPLKLVKQQPANRVKELLAFVHLSEKANKYPAQLSGGEKQRVAIARALATNPKVLLCDEPTSALDAQHSLEVITLLKRIQKELQTTIVVVSHEFDVIRALCNRVGILDKGELRSIVPISQEMTLDSYDSYYERAVAMLR